MAAPDNEINLLSHGDGVNLDADCLADLLCRSDVADQPLAVVGIAGPARSGKSFLLSYLSRYLRSQGWANPDDWIGDGETSLRDGFSWLGGKDPHTQGIKAWNEIFRVPDKDGEELNVLLIDTQGLFGPYLTKDDDVKLFALTITLCSHLIFNVEKKIDERKLESLEFFTRYAAAVCSQNDQERAWTAQPFQNLMFLVRDWPYAQENQFGADGGKSYVDECLMTNPMHEKGKSARQNIGSAVKRIDGFLMPHPGLNVERFDFSGNNGDVSEEFLEGVAELARILFDPENLEPRMLGDGPMTGRRLLSLMKACDRALQSDSIPEVHNSFCVFSRLKALTATEDAYKEFQSGVEQVAKRGGTCDILYETQFEECLQRYVSDSSVCDDGIQEEYLERLTLKCQEYFVNKFHWSDFQKRQAYNASIQALNGAWADYKLSMKEAMGSNGTPDGALTEMHEKYLCVALKDYKDDVTPRAAFNVDHYRLLKDLINNLWAKFKKINGRREGLVLLAALQEDLTHQYEAQLFLNDLTEHFREELEKFSHLYMDEKDLQQQIQKLQSEFVEIFNDKWRYEWPEIHPYRQDLLDVLESEHSDCIHCNSRNKDVLLNIMEESLFKAKAIYHEAMSKAISNGYCERKALKNDHELARQHVIDRLREELREIESSISGNIFRQLEAYTDSEYQKYSKLNECNAKNVPAPRNDIDIKHYLTKADSAMNFSTMVINRVNAKVREVKSIIKLADSIGLTNTSNLPYVLIGVAAIAGIAAIGYCVYRWYQKRNQGRQLMLTQ